MTPGHSRAGASGGSYRSVIACAALLVLVAAVILCARWFWRENPSLGGNPGRISESRNRERQPGGPDSYSRSIPRQSGGAAGEMNRDPNVLSAIRVCINKRDFDGVFDLLNGFGPGEFPEVWKMLNSLDVDSGFVSTMKTRALSRAVYLDGLESVVATIRSTTGPGTDRNSYISSAFHSSRESLNTLVSLASQLEQKGEKDAAYAGIARNIASRNSLSDIDLSSFSTLSPGLQKAVQSGISDYPTYGAVGGDGREIEAKVAEALRYVASLTEQIHLPVDFRNAVIDALIAKIPLQTWNAMKTTCPELVGDGEFLDSVVRSLSRQSPRNAIALYMDEGGKAPHALGAAFGRALSKDLAWAEDWYQTNKANLSDTEVGQVAAALATHEASNQSFTSAWDWLGRIGDPEQKKKTEGEVWRKEWETVRSAAKEQPKETVEGIVSGTSQHPDYWIEAAMRVWIANDSEAAAAWYEQTGRNLPETQSQYVAAAYAREALAQGDVPLARQWAERISDEKTRTRIDGEIAKAQQAAGE